jgi:hypothetical protein
VYGAGSCVRLLYNIDDTGPHIIEISAEQWREAVEWSDHFGTETTIEEVHCLDDIITLRDTAPSDDDKFDVALYVALMRRNHGDRPNAALLEGDVLR